MGVIVLLGTIVVPLAGLSSMPHQEARFLTPLLVPLVLTYTWNRDKLYRFFWVYRDLLLLSTGTNRDS